MSTPKAPYTITWLRDAAGRDVPYRVVSQDRVSYRIDLPAAQGGRPPKKTGKVVRESGLVELMACTVVPATAAQVEAWRNS